MYAQCSQWPERMSDALDREFQMAVGAMWVLEPESGSSEEQQGDVSRALI